MRALHLVDQPLQRHALATLARVAAAMPGALYVDEIDISRNADLERRYGLEIPVLEIDGKKVAKYRISEEDLRRRLEARG